MSEEGLKWWPFFFVFMGIENIYKMFHEFLDNYGFFQGLTIQSSHINETLFLKKNKKSIAIVSHCC